MAGTARFAVARQLPRDRRRSAALTGRCWRGLVFYLKGTVMGVTSGV